MRSTTELGAPQRDKSAGGRASAQTAGLQRRVHQTETNAIAERFQISDLRRVADKLPIERDKLCKSAGDGPLRCGRYDCGPGGYHPHYWNEGPPYSVPRTTMFITMGTAWSCSYLKGVLSLFRAHLTFGAIINLFLYLSHHWCHLW